MAENIKLDLPSCHYIEQMNGLDICVPKKKIHFHDEENNIKIVHVGTPNNLPIKTALLIGETGAGKTTVLNGIYNHLCNIEFEDTHRMQLIEEGEDGLGKEKCDSQTEGITGYLFFVNSSSQYKNNVMVIDTPGLNDTRGNLKHRQIMNQMKLFLKDEKYGLLDLHSLVFVVKASLNRCLEYYGKMIEQCVKLFGKDTENITQIVKTHAVDKNNSVQDIFKNKWNIATEKEFNFDNGPLYEPNVVMERPDKSIDETDIQMLKLRWDKQRKECDAFLQILFRMPSVSLQLTRRALKEKAYLEQTKENLIEKLEISLKYIIATKDNRKMLKDFEKNKESNKLWCGKETVIEKSRVPVNVEKRWYQFLAHVHNCKKCDKTCTSICHIWIPCPGPASTCIVCNCKQSAHERSLEVIKETLVLRKVTGQDMTEKYMQAKNQEEELQKRIRGMKEQEQIYIQTIAKMTKYVCFLTERLHQISRINSTQSSQVITEEILNGLINKDNKHIDELDEDCKSFIKTVCDAIEEVNINTDNWMKELEATIEYGNTAWERAKIVVCKTASVASSCMNRTNQSQEKKKRQSKAFF